MHEHVPASDPGLTGPGATQGDQAERSSLGPDTRGPESLWPRLDLGDPTVSGPLTVFPVVAASGGLHEQDTNQDGTGAASPNQPDPTPPDPALPDPYYLLLEDALQRQIARVTEVTEGGSVPTLLVEIEGEIPILGIQGEELVGAKQNRTLNASILLAPGKTTIPVTCVEAGRWAYRSPDFATGNFEHHELRKKKLAMVSRSRKHSHGDLLLSYGADQGEVWAEVDRESSRHAVHSPSSALSDVYDAKPIKDRLESLIAEITLPAGTRGAVIGIDQNLVAAEIFDHPAVFARIWPRILRSYALSALASDGPEGREARESRRDDESDRPRPTLGAAQALLSAPGAATPDVAPSIGLGEDIRWETDGFIAAALGHDRRLLHAVVYGREPERRPDYSWPNRRR